jgi:hypothetical protein
VPPVIILPGTSNHVDVGGGLHAWTVSWTDAHWNVSVPGNTILHWNIAIPGTASWTGPYKLDTWGRRHCRSGSGVYRLIGLDGAGAPVTLDRIGGRDMTGTLYIGCFVDRRRISQLVNSVRPYQRRNYGPRRYGYGDGHAAGDRLRSHFISSRRFPASHLAIAWCYSEECDRAERLLLDAYEASFGEDPPLNRR